MSQRNRVSFTFATNVWNHYQGAICKAFKAQLGDDFKMCLFERLPEERRQLGWASELPGYNWVVGPPFDAESERKLEDTVRDADVAVLCSCPEDIQSARARSGKLTYIMRERLWKKPFHWWRMLNPRFARGVLRYRNDANRENVYYLAVGASAAADAQRIRAHGTRIMRWGYFADIDGASPPRRNSCSLNLLWAGRMLPWKHVDILLRAVGQLANRPAFGRLDLIGAGPEEKRLRKIARALKLGDKCVFHAPMAHGDVRKMMREADIYILPSDRNEGWGVVANEAIAEGAILVANEEAGAAKVLITHGKTGFLYRDKDVGGLTAILDNLMSDKELRENTQQAAWCELVRSWHPQVGATRLIVQSRAILNNSPRPCFPDGPCSIEPGTRINTPCKP